MGRFLLYNEPYCLLSRIIWSFKMFIFVIHISFYSSFTKSLVVIFQCHLVQDFVYFFSFSFVVEIKCTLFVHISVILPYYSTLLILLHGIKYCVG